MHVTFFYVKKKRSWNDFSHLIFEFYFQRGVAVRFSDTLLEETGWLWNFFHSGIAQFGDPRVGQLGQEKKAAKVFKNEQESPGDNTINEPVLRHIRMLVCFCAQSEASRGQHLSGCFPDLIGRSSHANSTVRRVPVWLVQDWELSSSRVFSGAPKVYFTNFIQSSCITEEKILTNSQTLKGEKILLHVPNKYAE